LPDEGSGVGVTGRHVVTGQGDLFGALVGGDMSVSGSARVHYYGALRGQ